MKKALVIVIPALVLILGSVAVLGRMGILKIPGLTPTKKRNVAALQYGEPKDPKPSTETKTPPKPIAVKVKPKPKVEVNAQDPLLARKKLAKVWNELEPTTLVAMVKTWQVDELTDVFLAMDSSRVSEILTVMEPTRADEISRAILKRAGN